jgi:hypothetical protein
MSERGKLLDEFIDAMEQLSRIKDLVRQRQKDVESLMNADEKHKVIIAPSGRAVVTYVENNHIVIKRIWKEEA